MALRSRRTLSAVGIAIVLAIVVVVVGLTFFPSTGPTQVASGEPLADLRGNIAINSDSGGGVLNLTVSNAANYAFTSVTVSSISPSIPGVVHGVVFSYNGTAISQSNPLYIGDSASGVYDFSSGVSSGTSYSIFVTATLSNGQLITGNATIIAQA